MESSDNEFYTGQHPGLRSATVDVRTRSLRIPFTRVHSYIARWLIWLPLMYPPVSSNNNFNISALHLTQGKSYELVYSTELCINSKMVHFVNLLTVLNWRKRKSIENIYRKSGANYIYSDCIWGLCKRSPLLGKFSKHLKRNWILPTYENYSSKIRENFISWCAWYVWDTSGKHQRPNSLITVWIYITYSHHSI